MRKGVKVVFILALGVILVLALWGFSHKKDLGRIAAGENIKITVFAAKSLNSCMDEIIEVYKAENSAISFEINYDGSGTLKTQIEEGAECDVFISAAEKQMDELINNPDNKDLVVSGTVEKLLNNQVCLVTYRGSNTKVTELNTIGEAESFALAGESVPVGQYTRIALYNAGITASENADNNEISKALNNISINECSNVGAAAVAVAEAANEVGTVYYSDYKGYEDKLDIIEIIPNELTGDVIYPVAQINNARSSEAQKEAAADFINFLKSDKAKSIFEKYYFDTNVD